MVSDTGIVKCIIYIFLRISMFSRQTFIGVVWRPLFNKKPTKENKINGVNYVTMETFFITLQRNNKHSQKLLLFLVVFCSEYNARMQNVKDIL